MKRLAFLGLIFLFGCSSSSTTDPRTSAPESSSGADAAAADRKDATEAEPTSPTTQPWPFKDPEKLAVITLSRILDGAKPILYVVHDQDGDWQFLDGDDVSEEDAETVSFKRVVDHDPSLRELADLPNNWTAERKAAGQPWTRSPRN